MKKVTLVSAEPGAGNAIELSLGLRKYVDLTTVWYRKSAHKADYLEPQAKYGFGNIPPEGDEIIIMACRTFNLMKHAFRKRPEGITGFLRGYNEVKVIITDSRFMYDPVGYNRLLSGYQVWATICKIHFRGDEPTKPYYRPFDLSHIDRTKNKELTVAHSPFVAIKMKEKGSEEIEKIVKSRHVNFDLIMGVSWDESIQRKAKAHIFVDQIDFYKKDEMKFFDPDYTWLTWGRSGDEGMHLGCLTITAGRQQDIGHPIPPIAWCNKDNFGDILDYYLTHPAERRDLADAQYEWEMKYGTRDYAAKNVLNLS